MIRVLFFEGCENGTLRESGEWGGRTMPEFEEGGGNGLVPEYGVVPVYGAMPEYGTVPKYVGEGYGPADRERTVGNGGGSGGGSGKVSEYV